MRCDIDGSSEPELSNELRAEIGEFGKAGRPPTQYRQYYLKGG
jgi:hypothetical protein